MVRCRNPQTGFTLIEVMLVIAIIAILATIALPAFTGTSRKAIASAEVGPMFSDLRTRMDQYAQENGVYPLSIAGGGATGETTTWPAAPGAAKQTLIPYPPEWTALKVHVSGSDQVYCGYTFITGLAGVSTTIGPKGTAFGFTAPTVNWFYLLAHCDMDGDATLDSYYFSSSVDPTILKLDEGN